VYVCVGGVQYLLRSHQVHDVAAYKETRQVVERCIMEVALHDPEVKDFVVKCPPDLRFERATPELLQLVVMHLLPGKTPPLSRPVLAARLEVSEGASQTAFWSPSHRSHVNSGNRFNEMGSLGSLY